MAEAVTAKNRPAIKSKFLSYGTLSSKNLEASRRSYEEFLGLEVVRASPVSLKGHFEKGFRHRRPDAKK